MDGTAIRAFRCAYSNYTREDAFKRKFGSLQDFRILHLLTPTSSPDFPGTLPHRPDTCTERKYGVVFGSFCMNWAAYPEGYDVGSVADPVVNGEGGFHAPGKLTGCTRAKYG